MIKYNVNYILCLTFLLCILFYRKKGGEDSDDEDEEPTTVPTTTYKNQYKHIAAVHKAVGYASRAKTHAGRSNAMTKCTRMGVEAANRDKLARKDRGSASKSYDLDVPADAVVALTGWMGAVRDYECPWYISPSSWPEGLEDALLDLAIPCYRPQKAAVDAAHCQYSTSHQQLTERCLVTARASLESLHHNVVSALLAAASRPVSRKLELHKNAQPMYQCRKHPVFCGSVFKSKQYEVLAKMVREKQDEFERRRTEKDNAPLTKAALGEVITSMKTAVESTIRECMPTDGSSATVDHATADARTSTAATAHLRAAAGTSTATAGPINPTEASATAESASNTSTTAAAAASNPTGPQKKKRVSHQEAFVQHWADNEAVLEAKGVPRYVQNMGLSTIALIWKEYKYGLGGNKPLEWLESNAKGWRSYSQGSTAWNRRNGIYAEIKRMIAEDKLTEADAISNLQAQLDSFPRKGVSTGPDLAGFNANLKSSGRKRKAAGPANVEEV